MENIDFTFQLVDIGEREPSSKFYQSIKKRIQNDDFETVVFEGQEIKIYTPVLAYLFYSQNLTVKDLASPHTDYSQLNPVFNEKVINGSAYFKSFVEGYKQGVKYFDDTFLPIYSDGEKKSKDIKHHYFSDGKSSPPKQGWDYIKRIIPITLDHKSVKKYGYDSGFVSRVYEIVSKHESVFGDFLKPLEKRQRDVIKFESYLNQKGKAVSSYLVKNYTNAKPEIIAFMLFALESLNYLNAGSLTNNKTKLHNVLKNTFGEIGTRQSLTANILRLDSPDSYLSDQIEAHKNEIKKAAKSKN